MRNLLYAILAAMLVFAVLYFPQVVRFWGCFGAAVFTFIGAYLWLALRTRNQLQEIMMKGAQMLQKGSHDQALKVMEQGYTLAPHQFGVRSQVDAQLGVVNFMLRRFDKALPLLENAQIMSDWMTSGMLGVLYYKRKRHEDIKKLWHWRPNEGKKKDWRGV